MDFTLEALTFENCDKAYEIDRSDIPEAFVDDVPTLIATLKFGFENNLKGYAFLITKEGRAIGTILLGEGLYCENDPEELKDKPFYRLVSFVLDKNFRGKGLGSKILESTIEKVYNDFGIHPIVLGVHKDNEKAARFYLKNGFTRTSCMDGDDYCFIRNPKKEGIQMKEYKFYGWQTADCKPADPTYEKIQNPRHLYDILSEIWCEYTCAPRLREKWSRENQTVGQCSITAFLAQDIFGGKVYGILRQGGNYHCYNVVGDCVFDLTSEQFGDEKLCYENNPEQFRETHCQKTEKHERYKYLKAELLKKLEEL